MSGTNIDALVYARLRAGRPVNGEAERVSDLHRLSVRRMARAPLEDRGRIWDEMLGDLPDDERDEFIRAVGAVNPDEDPPESEAWPRPLLSEIIPASPFPVEVLPDAAKRVVQQGATAIGCPDDFLALSVLVVAAGAIGRSTSIKIKDGYYESSLIYGGNVGWPSDGKSPAQKAVAGPIYRIDQDLDKAFQEELKAHQSNLALHDAGRNGKKSGADRMPKPPAPVPRRIDVDDATMEVLPQLMADNPRGLTMVRDELTALMTGLNQFKSGKGNDRQFLLKVWSQQPIKKDRVGNEYRSPVRVHHPFLCILGGIPPDMLGEMVDAKGRNDGFLDRFLMAYPDRSPKPRWTKQGLPEATAENWFDLINRLWSLEMELAEGVLRPKVLDFSTKGEEAWVDLVNAHRDGQNAEGFPCDLLGPWGKLEQYAGRLSLNLTMLHYAASIDPTGKLPPMPRVGRDRVEDAWKAISYFKNNSRRVLAAMSLGRAFKSGDAIKSVLDWIKRNKKAIFKKSELTQNFRKLRDEECDEVLGWLVGHHCIRRQPEPPPVPGRRGRKLQAVYEVNPALHAPDGGTNFQNF